MRLRRNWGRWTRAHPLTFFPYAKRARNSRANRVRVKSHLDFIDSCLAKRVTPRGLTVGVTCNAFLAHYSDVKDQFHITKSQAEAHFVRSLKTHYETALKRLDHLVDHNAQAMDVLLAGSSEAETREHQKMMELTSENIQKLTQRLQARKQNKINHITTHPGPSPSPSPSPSPNPYCFMITRGPPYT